METERKQFESASSASSAFAYPSEEDFTKWMQGEGWLFICDESYHYPEFDSDYLYSLDEVRQEFVDYVETAGDSYHEKWCKNVIKMIDKVVAGKTPMESLEEELRDFHMFTAHSLGVYCESPEMDEIIEHRDKCRHRKKSYTNIVKVGYYSQM